MITIEEIRQSQNQIIILGNHPFIIQSILDFDWLSGKKEPSVKIILNNENGFAKYFWGQEEILLPVRRDFKSFNKDENGQWWFLNLFSGRRTLSSTEALLKTNIPNLAGGVMFAEGVPEKHAQTLNELSKAHDLLLIGSASVGLIIPGMIKLGPIGGVTPEQIEAAGVLKKGDCAVISASGGMTNELINMVNLSGRALSFAFSTGGERFPLPEIKTAFELAESDPQTKTILYYGELGGTEEYQLIEMKERGQLTKPVVMHIAGTVADLFPESPQFGHAKAKAASRREKASVKREELLKAGFGVSRRFHNLLKY